MRNKIVIVLVFVLTIVIYSFGQQSTNDQKQKQGEEDVVKLSTTLVQIDAVVTDKNGKHITDLKPEDFEILQDGKPQKITNFSYIVTQPEKAEPIKTTKGNDKNNNNDVAAPIGVTGLKREQVKRTIAIVLNDFTRESLSVDNVLYVQKAIRTFINEQMEPGDLVAIIRTRRIGGAMQQFTSNKQELLAAVDRIYEGPSSSTFQDDSDCGGARQEECEFNDFGQVYFNGSTLSSLGYIISGMRNLPGRKSVLLVSQGLRFDFENPVIKQQIYKLVTLANQASVVINTLDPRGLPVLLGPTFSAANGTVYGAAAQGARPPADIGTIHMTYFSSQGGLDILAKQTGGLFFHDSNDLTAGVRKIVNDQSGYYLIAYQPEEGTFDHQGGFRFHTWKVRVTRPNLVVRTRSGFLGISDEESKPARNTRNDQLSSALTTPFGSSDIPIKVTGIVGSDPASKPEVNILAHIDSRALTFTDEPDGGHKATIDVVAVTFGDNGNIVDQLGSTQTIVAKGQMYEKIMRDGLLITSNLPLKRPGGYQLRVAVRDVASQRTGSASQFVLVPNVRNGRLAISGIVAAGSQSAEDPNEAQAGAAVRKLKPGTTLDYTYTIYNPVLDQSGKNPKLMVETRLFKDDKLVYSDKPVPLNPGDATDLKQIKTVGAMKLGADLKPGEYVLQVVVTDELIKQKRKKVSQWVTFEIVQ